MPRVFKTPGVYRQEIDLSDILVPTGISTGGIVIRSTKGPICRPVLVTNDKEFIETFGQPYYVSGIDTTTLGDTTIQVNTKKLIPELGYGSYAALEFLKESQFLYVVRGFSENDKFANASIKDKLNASNYLTSGVYSTINISARQDGDNPDRVDKIYSIDSLTINDVLLVAALYPGEDGNKIAVTIEAANDSCDWKYNYDNYTSSTNISAFPIASKVFKLNVYEMGNVNSWEDYKDNSITGLISGGLRITPVETFYGTLSPYLDGNKNQLFIENVVNGISKYIYVKAGNYDSFTSIKTSARPVSSDSKGEYVDYAKFIRLSGGVYKKESGIGETTGWDLFKDREFANIGILICPDWTKVVKQKINEIIMSRMDCIAAVQAGTIEDNTVDRICSSEEYGYTQPSYIAIYGGYSKVWDNYNSKFVYIPNSIFGASLMARCDAVANPWDAPAGISRAVMAVFDQNKIFSFNEIGSLYDFNINVPRFIRGTGYVMWGQKTAQLKKSALDRINVRRMLLYVENNIEKSLLPFIFENNNDKTRLRVFSLLDEFMSSVKVGGGVTAYQVICDETNNTSQIIDSNQLAVDIYLQPTRTVEFIKFTTIVTRTGINFSEVIGS